MKWWQALIFSLAIAFTLVATYQLGVRRGKIKASEEIQEKADTVFFMDTVLAYTPKPVTVRIKDTVFIKADTVVIRDSVYYPVVIEQKVYQDSLYRAVVSGFRPSLDSMEVYKTTVVINTQSVVEKKVFRRFTYGAQLGFGGVYGLCNKSFDCGPYLGLGVGINF